MSITIDYDPLTGIRTTFDYDPVSDKTIIGYDDPTGFTDKVLDWNKSRQANHAKQDAQVKRGLSLYARIPPMAQLDMLQRHGVKVWAPEHKRKMMALLNTSEYQDCRVSRRKHDR